MLDGGWGIFDGSLNPTTGVAITATAVSTNVLDLMVGTDIGAGLAYDPELHVDIITSLTGNTGTLTVQLQCAPDNGSGSPGSFFVILQSPTLAIANLTAGSRAVRYAWPVIQGLFSSLSDVNPPRFLRLNYVVGSGPFTAGTVLSYLNVDREERLIYPSNFVTA
jgi:hypothetical protein